MRIDACKSVIVVLFSHHINLFKTAKVIWLLSLTADICIKSLNSEENMQLLSIEILSEILIKSVIFALCSQIIYSVIDMLVLVSFCKNVNVLPQASFPCPNTSWNHWGNLVSFPWLLLSTIVWNVLSSACQFWFGLRWPIRIIVDSTCKNLSFLHKVNWCIKMKHLFHHWLPKTGCYSAP